MQAQFLNDLASLSIAIRAASAVCWITLPRCIRKEDEQRLCHLADLVLSMNSFLGSGFCLNTDAGYGDFDGLFVIEKRAAKHVFAGQAKENTYLYKLKRKKLVLEVVSLPPEESRTETKLQDF